MDCGVECDFWLNFLLAMQARRLTWGMVTEMVNFQRKVLGQLDRRWMQG